MKYFLTNGHCNLCPLEENDNYLHLLLCCINKHIINMHTKRHNKVVHALSNTLFVHPTTRSYMLTNAKKFKNKSLDCTLPSWLLPYISYLLRCKNPACLWLDTLCISGTTPTTQPPFAPNSSLQIQIYEFTYYNDRFPQATTTRKLE